MIRGAGWAGAGLAGAEGRVSLRAAGVGSDLVDTLLRYHTAPPKTAELIRADDTTVRARDDPRIS